MLFLDFHISLAADPGGSDVKKNLPAMWEIWVPSLSLEDPLEKEMKTHSNILSWIIC